MEIRKNPVTTTCYRVEIWIRKKSPMCITIFSVIWDLLKTIERREYHLIMYRVLLYFTAFITLHLWTPESSNLNKTPAASHSVIKCLRPKLAWCQTGQLKKNTCFHHSGLCACYRVKRTLFTRITVCELVWTNYGNALFYGE